jgi:hypothetical protein
MTTAQAERLDDLFARAATGALDEELLAVAPAVRTAGTTWQASRKDIEALGRATVSRWRGSAWRVKVTRAPRRRRRSGEVPATARSCAALVS